MIERPRGRDLSRSELEELVGRLAARPDLWAHRVRHDPGARVYEELLDDPHLTVWLICWMHDHDTGFHDHDHSSGAVAVVDGAVREERLVLGGSEASRLVVTGSTFSFAASDIHRVVHAGAEPAVTLHAYSPPLSRLGAYEVGPGGLLVRHSLPSSHELRPLAGAR
jgi:predicted metal-dependent enzyme (double-stranded beta helix superfamily)